MLCESCHENPATVFVTQIVDAEVMQLRLCESCARQRAGGLGSKLGSELGDASIENMMFDLFNDVDNERGSSHGTGHFDEPNADNLADNHYISEVFMELQNSDSFDDEFPDEFSPEFRDDRDELDDLDDMDEDDEDFDGLPDDITDDIAAELEAAEDAPDDAFNALNDLIKSAPFSDAPERREVLARRCPKCSITWDRLRQDGRAGCAQCYETFADQLHEVMQRVQHAPQHHGKKPRAAEKRRNRLEHLRARRDHRLEMLNRRLAEAVRDEKYEEAAKLRDQIKMVESTIVQEP